MTEQPDSRAAAIDFTALATVPAAAGTVRRAGLLLLTALAAMVFAPNAHGAVPTAHVTPAPLGGPPGKYRFQTANGRIRCEMNVLVPRANVRCWNGHAGAILSYSGEHLRWPIPVPVSPAGRNVPAGTRLAIHAPVDKMVYFCRAYLTAMRCTHSATHKGFLVGLSFSRVV